MKKKLIIMLVCLCMQLAIFGQQGLIANANEIEPGQTEETDELTDISSMEATLSSTSCNYTGTARKPKVNILGLTQNTDFTVSYSNNINAGTANVVITGIGSYTGTITKTFTIKKLTPTVKITSSSYSFDYAKVKSQAVYSDVLSVSGAKGTKTFTKVSGSTNLTVTSSGKIKVKAGTTPGTYKISVKVKSAATTNYNAANSEAKTITVKVYYHVTTTAYKKYLGKWEDTNTYFTIKAVNPYYIYGILTNRLTGEQITVKKDLDMTKAQTITLKSKLDDVVKFRILLKYGSPYTGYGGKRCVEGPKFYIESDNYSWRNVAYMNGKPGYWVFVKYL